MIWFLYKQKDISFELKIEDQSTETDTWQYFQCIKSEIESSKTTVKSYDCEYYGKAFIKHDNLSEYIKTHTWEILYICKHCGMLFTLQ